MSSRYRRAGTAWSGVLQQLAGAAGGWSETSGDDRGQQSGSRLSRRSGRPATACSSSAISDGHVVRGDQLLIDRCSMVEVGPPLATNSQPLVVANGGRQRARNWSRGCRSARQLELVDHEHELRCIGRQRAGERRGPSPWPIAKLSSRLAGGLMATRQRRSSFVRRRPGHHRRHEPSALSGSAARPAARHARRRLPLRQGRRS